MEKIRSLLRPHVISLSASLACCGAAFAHTDNDTSTLPAVVVVGSPVIEDNRTDAFGSLSTEVKAAQIRDLNALDLSSVLRRTPGVSVSRFNPVGSFGGDEGGAVFVRGLGASRPGSEIKTYIDGIPFYMGVWNHPLLDLIPVNGIDRITVYKGPQPQTFGNTFAAIDVSPKRAMREGVSADARLSAGSFSTIVEQASLQVRQGDLGVSLTQGEARSNGSRPDGDGRLSNVMGRIDYRLTPQWSAGLSLLYADNKVSDPGQEGLPATKTGKFDTRGGFAAFSVAHEHEHARGTLQIYDNSGQSNWRDNPAQADTLSKFRLSGLRWMETLQPWTGGEIVAGVDLDRMSGSLAFGGFTAFDGVSLRLTSPHVAVSQSVMLGNDWKATPSIGVRLYDHSVYGHSSAPHAGLVLDRGDSLSFRANASRGLNHPGLDAALLNAIVPPLASAPTSWRGLRPERMNHMEVGVRWSPRPGSSVDLAVFEDRLSQRYVFAFPPAVAVPGLTNLGYYRIKGVELAAQYSMDKFWSLFAGLTLLNPSRSDLPYAPRRVLSLGTKWQKGAWRASVDAQTQSGMFTLNRDRSDGSSSTSRVGGFAVVNLRVAYALPSLLGPRGEVFIALENLADRRYAYRSGYPMPGRSAQLGVTLSL
ncbi:TonB-dependent receptor [Acidovorax sp. SUPP3334]|uniref:TonB-dependent receptor n=1 Tax=Acidovorax sp. SUPP3334 TaxID=2920881 RepID=UPI0023DE6471|nr:TonB-dependent receptor [Acidovorax sp. SUPP3334]GKT24894.1 TonB-dependent receptor [Acidovorax sp. SUPP3334]